MKGLHLSDRIKEWSLVIGAEVILHSHVPKHPPITHVGGPFLITGGSYLVLIQLYSCSHTAVCVTIKGLYIEHTFTGTLEMSAGYCGALYSK